MTCDELLDVLDLPTEDLAPDDRARRDEHLAACEACRERAFAHEVAAAALARAADGPPPPAAVRERLLVAAALEAKARAAADAPAAAEVAALPIRLRCTYCHAGLATGEAVYCADCLAPAHRPCFVEHGRCPAPGCRGERFVEPRRALPARPRDSRRGLGLLLALPIAAATAIAALWPQPPELPAQVSSVSILETSGVVMPAPPPAPPAVAPIATDALVAPAPEQYVGESLRVLYVEAQPRWEYRYLKQLLLREPQVRTQTFLLSADPDFEQERSPGLAALRELPDGAVLRANYDLVILGDVAGVACGTGPDPVTVGRSRAHLRELLAALPAAVSRGVALLVVDGELSGAAWARTPIGALLPVRLGRTLRRRATDEPWRPRLTTEGIEALPLEQRADESVATWSQLPGVFAYTPVLSATPDAHVLLVQPAGPEAAPLLAWRSAGRGACAWLGFDEAWRWRRGVGARFFGRFYGDLIGHLLDVHHPRGPARLTTWDGRTLQAEVQWIGARGTLPVMVLTKDGMTRALSTISTLRLSDGPSPRGDAVVLAGGDVLRGWFSQADDEGERLDSPILGPLRLSRADLRLMVPARDGPAVLPADPLQPTTAAGEDALAVRRDGAQERGVFRRQDGAGVELSAPSGGAWRRVPWETIEYLSLGATGGPPPAASPRVRLDLTDGSTLTATLLEFDGDVLRVRHPVLGALELPAEAISTLSPAD
jgi:hypothetical protein